MKAKIGFLWFAVLFCSSMAFAVNGSAYYNLVSIRTGGIGPASMTTVVLSQGDYPCTNANWTLVYDRISYSSNGMGYIGTYLGMGPMARFSQSGNCLAAKPDTPENLYEMLNSAWIEGDEGMPLALGSDIDLGEFNDTTEVGTCEVNHVPLPSMPNSAIHGNGFTVKHLCYAANSMTSPVGLFESIRENTVDNFKLNGVRIYIDGKSHNGADYYPVGALVGVLELSTVDGIVIANDSIQAPVAGGLIGFVKSSTIKNISGDDDINVSNKVSITKGYAGSKVIGSVSDYQVFLGGIVGVDYRFENDDPSFLDDSVKVEVHDYGVGHKSALGGIAGLFSTTGESIENVQVYSKYKTDETVPTRISGGSAMGGLFGAMVVYSENNVSKVGDFTVSNSRFDGEIYDAASPDVIAVGGLIGLDSLLSGMSVKIVNSGANVNVQDSLKEANNFRYYAGGILGYGSSCRSGSKAGSDFVSILGSKTSGSITVAASAAEVKGVHSQTYLGGIAGDACLAQDDTLGLVNDTSSVVISARVKTSVDKNRMSNGANDRDSLFVGGMMGFVRVAVSDTHLLTGLYYTGSITVEDSLNNVFVGGIVGAFPQAEGGKSLHFENVVVNTEDVIHYTPVSATATTTIKQTAKIGGICGLCNEVAEMNKVGVKGNILVEGAYAGDSLIVGGLLGSVYTSLKMLQLKNTMTNGNILVDESIEQKQVGYIWGSALLNKGFELISNYHYGEKDLSLDAFGIFNAPATVENWRTSDSIFYVVRNGKKKNYTEVHRNGIVVTDSMKKSSFAGFMNKAYGLGEEAEAQYAWTYVSGKNGGLPIFADEKNPPVVPEAGSFVVTFIADRDSVTIKQETVAEGEAATAPALEDMPEFEGYTFSGKWNKKFNKVTSDLTVSAIYSINSYNVQFLDYDKTLLDENTVEYLAEAEPPTAPERTGYTFIGWDDSSYTAVKKDLEINAVYVANRYRIVFNDYNGEIVWSDSVAYDGIVDEPVGLTRERTPAYQYVFKGWTPAVARVTGDAVYTAVYDSVKNVYAVVFVDDDETQIGDTVWVEYGDAAVAPASPEREGYVFVEWDRHYDVVTENIKIKARYELIPVSSSSEIVLSSSSSEIQVSSSSAEMPESSSDEVVSSSSAPVVESSSSVRGEIRIADAKIEQSGNAILLAFTAENADASTPARVVVKGKDGVVVDTVLDESIVRGGKWQMAPAPMGEFKVSLMVGDKVENAKFEGAFEVASKMVAAPGSWQMISLSAFDRNSAKAGDATFYWWDERNPVGDYWQYRSIVDEDSDATRGFWYGTTTGMPLVLREAPVVADSEIVWNLDSLYSGWNLVANPYGWYVDLSKGATDNGSKVTFWRWNSALSEYEVPTVVGPYEAVWAKVSQPTTWKMPAAPVFDIRKIEGVDEKKPLRKASADVPGAWNLNVALSDEFGKKDSWNVIGAGSEESLEEPPAGMGDRVSLSIREVNDDGCRGAKLAKSIKAVSGEYRWILDVSANSAREGSLSFEGIAELKKQNLKLFVTSEGETVEVEDGTSVNVPLAKSVSQVEVRVAPSNAVVASKIRGLRSFAEGLSLQLSFEAPENLAGASANYVIAGVDGRAVASGNFTASAGTNRIAANVPRSGIYFVKIKVGSQDLSAKILKK